MYKQMLLLHLIRKHKGETLKIHVTSFSRVTGKQQAENAFVISETEIFHSKKLNSADNSDNCFLHILTHSEDTGISGLVYGSTDQTNTVNSLSTI